jgi:hypothetical protein
MLSLFAPTCGFTAAPIVAPRIAHAASSIQMGVADMCAALLRRTRCLLCLLPQCSYGAVTARLLGARRAAQPM